MRELRLAPARECTRFGAPQGMAFIQGGSAAGRWRTDTFNWQQCRTRSICSLILEKPASASQLRQRLRSHQGVELLPGNPQRFSGRHHSSVKKLGPIPPAAIGPAVKPGELSRYHRSRGALHGNKSAITVYGTNGIIARRLPPIDVLLDRSNRACGNLLPYAIDTLLNVACFHVAHISIARFSHFLFLNNCDWKSSRSDGGGEISRGGCLILIFYGLGEAAASHVITREALLYPLLTQETASDFSPEQRR